MTEVTWATFGLHGSQPMGLQGYERDVTGHLTSLAPAGLTFRTAAVRGLRSGAPGARRIPMQLLDRAPPRRAVMLGRLAYRGATAVHRFDLRLPPAAVPEVVTVHDVAPLRFPDEGVIPAWSLATIRRAARVICASEFAAEEIRSLLGVEDIDIIPHGVDDRFRHAEPLTGAAREANGLPGRFVLTAGGTTRRKNLAMLARAWREIAPRIPDLALVLTGPPSAARDALFAGVPRVVFAGYRDAADMPAIVASAAAVIVPSVYEGFGLPTAEAMAAGTPVVAVGAGPTPEVCGDAAVLVPDDADALAAAVASTLRDGALCDDLARRGRDRAAAFTWPRAAELHAATYRKAFG